MKVTSEKGSNILNAAGVLSQATFEFLWGRLSLLLAAMLGNASVTEEGYCAWQMLQ